MEFLLTSRNGSGNDELRNVFRFNVSTNYEATARVLLRDTSKILFPNNPVNVPVIKWTPKKLATRRFGIASENCQRYDMAIDVSSYQESTPKQSSFSRNRLSDEMSCPKHAGLDQPLYIPNKR